MSFVECYRLRAVRALFLWQREAANMIRLTAEQIKEAEAALSHIPGAMPKAMVNALNRAADAARTEAARRVRDSYYIKVGDVRDTIKIERASAESKAPRVTVRSRGTRRPLIHFRVKPDTPRPKNPPVILRAGVKRDGGLKGLPHVFVARGTSSGKVHVLKRTTGKRYPLHIKYGPSVPEMIGVENIRKWVEQRATETLGKRLEHEIDRVLKGK